nr:hypothetical protein [uncultured Merdimonas sp.]
MAAKVENFCMRKQSKQISVNASERACINCIWYEQYWRKNRGNVATWVPTSTGHCILHDSERGALRQPCDKYETEG